MQAAKVFQIPEILINKFKAIINQLHSAAHLHPDQKANRRPSSFKFSRMALEWPPPPKSYIYISTRQAESPNASIHSFQHYRHVIISHLSLLPLPITSSARFEKLSGSLNILQIISIFSPNFNPVNQARTALQSHVNARHNPAKFLVINTLPLESSVNSEAPRVKIPHKFTGSFLVLI